MEDKSSFILSKYELSSKIGVGQFGEVFKVKEIETGAIFAAKISLTINEEDEERDPDEILNHVREVNIMSQLNHPCIVKFIGYSGTDFYGDQRPVIITEFMTRGSLTEYIELERKSISDPDWNATKKIIILYGIASAMSYLHKHNIIHRDLKPDNILMDDELNPKISDFGFSKILHSNQNSMSFASQVGFKGTAAYSPPEVLTDDDCIFSKAGDVYAFGMIAYQIMMAKYPFKNTNYTSFCRKIVNGERPQLDNSVSESYKLLIQRCWAQEPSDRPTFDQIVDELKNDPGFITDLVDEDTFLNYVEYIDHCQISFAKGRKILSFVEFTKNKEKTEDENQTPQKVDENNFSNILNSNNKSQESKIKKYTFKILETDTETKEDEAEDVSTFLRKSGVFNVFKLEEDESQTAESEEAFTLLERSGVFNKIKINENEEQQPLKIIENEENQTSKIVENEDEDPDELFQNWDKFYHGKGVPVDMEEAANYCKKAADKGHVEAMYQYAIMLQKGEGVEVNIAQSAYYLFLAANFGHAELAYCVGLKLRTGQGLAQDKVEAARYFKIAAEKGHILGIKEYVTMNIEGDGIPVNILEARKYLKIGADQGVPIMMETYAILHDLSEESGIPFDKKEAAKYYKMAADHGLEKSMFYYGKMLCFGDGIPSDIQESKKYTKMSADKGFPIAMYIYALMLIDEDSSNKEEILKYMKMAADNDVSEAMNKYAYFRLFEEGYEHDLKEAFTYYKKSAEKGNVTGLYLYSKLLSVDSPFTDKKESVKYLKLAANQGYQKAMFDYGSMLFEGDGVDRNIEEGLKYIKMAADKGLIESAAFYGKVLCYGEGIEVDRNEGLRYLKFAAENEDLHSMVLYGTLTLDQTESPEESIKYIKTAADKGLIHAMYVYGTCLIAGRRIDANPVEAAKYLKVAADNDHTDAMYLFGLMLNEGEGIEMDKTQAAFYLKKAADKGNDNSSFEYGLLLYKGDVNQVNKKEAAAYIKKAADNGNVKAMAFYGNMLSVGDGIPANEKEAQIYLKKAEDQGYKNEDSEKLKAFIQLSKMMNFLDFEEKKPNFEAEGIRFSEKKEGVNLKKFKLYEDRFVISESKNGKIIKTFNTGEYNIVEAKSNFGMDVSTSVDLLHKTESVRLKLQTKEEKEKLLQEFAQVLKTNRKTPHEIEMQIFAPINVPSNLIQRCMTCFSKFSFVSTKYHCSICGTCVCKKCFQQSIAIVDVETKKVCCSCFNNITKFKKRNTKPTNEQIIIFIRKMQLDAIENQNNPRFYKKV